jgi:hypothetical protein
MRELWCGDPEAPLSRERFAPLFPGKPPAGDARRAERSMRRRGLYDTPVAVLAGEWFFAHERVATIAERLDELGWRAAA